MEMIAVLEKKIENLLAMDKKIIRSAAEKYFSPLPYCVFPRPSFDY